MEGQELCDLGLQGLLLLKNDSLIGQYSPHVSMESLHILCDEDSVLLVLIPECIEALSK